MVIDASALIAVLKQETDGQQYLRAILRAQRRLISPVNWYEAALVAERPSPAGFDVFEAFANRVALTVVPVTESHMRLAHRAWRNFGKGRHPAKLNLGDCFAYALARAMREPLLFKGGDFAHTDIVPAL